MTRRFLVLNRRAHGLPPLAAPVRDGGLYSDKVPAAVRLLPRCGDVLAVWFSPFLREDLVSLNPAEPHTQRIDSYGGTCQF